MRPTTAPCAETEEIPFSKIRSRIAERLSHSKKTIPHYYLYVDVNMASAMRWRKATKEASATKISVTDIIVSTVAHALRAYPKLNAHVCEDKLILHKHIHIGVAVSVDDGLVVPVIPISSRPCRLLRAPAGKWPFPTLSLRSLHGRLGPYSVTTEQCICPFLPARHRSPLRVKRIDS